MDPDIKDICIFLKSPRYTIWTSHIYYFLSPLVTIKLLNISFVVVQWLSHVWLFVTPWTAALQASSSAGSRRKTFHSWQRSCRRLLALILHYLLEFGQIHVHWVDDAIQSSHPLSPPSLPALNLSQHQGLFQWVSSSHQVAKGLELQLQHQIFQWMFRVDFL